MRRKIIASRNPCNLTWEKQNPINYIYSSNEAIKRLKKIKPKKSLKKQEIGMYIKPFGAFCFLSEK